MNKKHIAVIFGGTNTEHEVSLVSAKSILKNLNKNKYKITKIKIQKNGKWLIKGKKTTTPPNWKKFDVVFPVLHGPCGEDGTIQGMLEFANVPYVGSGVLSSAICMDKVIQKHLSQSQNIPTTKFTSVTKTEWVKDKQKLLRKIQDKLSLPLFVKPANQGSSIGITKVKTQEKIEQAIHHAFKLDNKVIIENTVNNAREIECSILGNNNPKASVLGEIIPSNEFYNYSAKYVDGKSKEVIPAKLPKNIAKEIQKLAIKSYKLLNCKSLARVDFLVNAKTNKYYLNEVNTMPGFTPISMYPKLWKHSGLSYKKLLEKLIELALQIHQEKQEINLNYKPKKDWYKN